MKHSDQFMIIIVALIAGISVIYWISGIVFIPFTLLLAGIFIMYIINFQVGMEILKKEMKLRELEISRYWKAIDKNPEILSNINSGKMGFR